MPKPKASPRSPPEAEPPIPLRHPENIGCTHAGLVYETDPSGAIRVPAAAVPDLAAHGFTVIQD